MIMIITPQVLHLQPPARQPGLGADQPAVSPPPGLQPRPHPVRGARPRPRRVRGLAAAEVRGGVSAGAGDLHRARAGTSAASPGLLPAARLPGPQPRGVLREPCGPHADAVPGPGLGQLARDGQHAVSVQRQDHQRAAEVRAVSPVWVGRLGGAGA